MNGLQIIFFAWGVISFTGLCLYMLWRAVKPIARIEDSRLKDWSKRKGY